MDDPNIVGGVAIANAHRLQAAGWKPLMVLTPAAGIASIIPGLEEQHLLWICPDCSAVVDEPRLHLEVRAHSHQPGLLLDEPSPTCPVDCCPICAPHDGCTAPPCAEHKA